MAVARSKTVIPGQAGFYHCYTRCVRRSFLCGSDQETGENYEHRRQWLVERLHAITRLFAVDIYAYAIMHNHYHIVLYIDPERVKHWSDADVIEKWSNVYAWRRKKSREKILPVKPSVEQINEWRTRLGSLSWIMRTVNEPVARWANVEDDVTGHFWEGRFNSLPILDEIGLVACMSYVDLNPIRGGLAMDLDSSEFTSIQKRIDAIRTNSKQEAKNTVNQINRPLGPLLTHSSSVLTLSMNLRHYIDLVHHTAADLIYDKSFANKSLSRYGVSVTNWVYVVKRLRRLFRTAIGDSNSYGPFLQGTRRVRHRDLTGRRYLYA